MLEMFYRDGTFRKDPNYTQAHETIFWQLTAELCFTMMRNSTQIQTTNKQGQQIRDKWTMQSEQYYGFANSKSAKN
jgi:hypothetical protein